MVFQVLSNIDLLVLSSNCNNCSILLDAFHCYTVTGEELAD